MLDTYNKLRDLLDKRERRNAILLFVMILLMGLLEVMGVASIMPFIAIVANPEVIRSNPIFAAVYDLLDFSDDQSFLLFMGTGVFIIVVGNLCFKAFTQWTIARYTHMRGYTLSSRLLRSCLNQPYTWFLNRHSADLGKSVLSEVEQVISTSLMPAMQLLAHTVVVIFLVTLVVAVEPMVAITAVVTLSGAYTLIYWILRRYLGHIGTDRVIANRERFQIAQEAFGGIKDVKVLGLEEGYIRSFNKPAARFAKRKASKEIISALPQFFLQGIAFGGILAILLVLLASRNGELSAVLPLMALYAFAGTRLLPAMQQVYNALTKIRFGQHALDVLHSDMEKMKRNILTLKRADCDKSVDPIKFRECLQLKNIHYTYPKARNPALKNLSLTIRARTTVALVGSTGAGKTTVADLILGLLEPQRGDFRVDDQYITAKNIQAWQRSIGYVPQNIFLSDESVAANIAFGQPVNHINMAAVERAARIAELHDFVTTELPEGYQTAVGERGIRLSGGQRQRIGIARALYYDPDVLILDEATSALDNLTEKAVMEAVHNLSKQKTVIMIAHRLSTVKNCDCLFMLENGQLKSCGTYAELIESSQEFQRIAGVAG